MLKALYQLISLLDSGIVALIKGSATVTGLSEYDVYRGIRHTATDLLGLFYAKDIEPPYTHSGKVSIDAQCPECNHTVGMHKDTPDDFIAIDHMGVVAHATWPGCLTHIAVTDMSSPTFKRIVGQCMCGQTRTSLISYFSSLPSHHPLDQQVYTQRFFRIHPCWIKPTVFGAEDVSGVSVDVDSGSHDNGSQV